MSFMTVVFRMLDKAGATFIEPRREDGHGSAAATPSHVADDYATTQSAADQLGADAVLTFNFTTAADFVMVDVDATSSTDYATYRARALLDGTAPSATTGFVCRSGATTYLPFPTSGVVKVYAPTGTVVAVQVGRRA